MYCKAEIPTVYRKQSAEVIIVSMDKGGVKNELVASEVLKSASDTGELLGSQPPGS